MLGVLPIRIAKNLATGELQKFIRGIEVEPVADIKPGD